MRLTVKNLRERFNVDIWHDTCGGQRFYSCSEMDGLIIFELVTTLKELEEKLMNRSDEE